MSQISALLLTLAIEVPIVIALLKFRPPPFLPRWTLVVLVAFAASMITHPIAWSANIALADSMVFGARATVIEIGVIAAEALVFRLGLGIRWTAALLISVTANLCSFGFGLVWMFLIS